MHDGTEVERLRADVAQLVHEIRQPLSTLMVLADNARRLDLDDDGVAMVDDIARQVAEAVAVARRISRLVD